MKRNLAIAGAVLMMAGFVANAETPAHSTPVIRTAPAAPQLSEAQKQQKLFQLVSACLAERPGGSSSGVDDILKKVRGN